MKNAFTTGANRGIGLETAKQLTQRDYFVYMGSRNQAKGEQAKQELQRIGLNNIDLLELDVKNINSIKKQNNFLKAKYHSLMCSSTTPESEGIFHSRCQKYRLKG